MENFKKKITILLVVSISLILLSGFLLFFFMKDINKKVKETNRYEQELFQRSILLDKIQNLEKEKQQADLYFTALNQALPTETEIITLESKLKNLASLYNLNNLSFRFGTLNQPQGEEPKSYSFNLIIDGEINALINWLAAFQRLSYSIRLEQIEITRTSSNNSNSSLMYNIKILGRIYLR